MQSIIRQDLAEIIAREKERGRHPLYLKSALKEYLQVHTLNFIYTHPVYSKKFLFTGGSCLRHCFGLNRLSEDLDFDLAEEIDVGKMAKEIDRYWRSRFGETSVSVSVKQNGRQILQRFPFLADLGIAGGQESPVLYVKSDLSPALSKNYTAAVTLKYLYGFSYLMFHYDLPSLMAGKIHALLFRQRFEGKNNTEAVKGRDFFDLLWFLQNRVKLNLPRLQDLMQRKIKESEVWSLVDERVEWAIKLKDSFARDLLPFIENQAIVLSYIENYQKQYQVLRPRFRLS